MEKRVEGLIDLSKPAIRILPFLEKRLRNSANVDKLTTQELEPSINRVDANRDCFAED